MDNSELTRLFAEDQDARSGPIEAVDITALNREDSARRDRLRVLVRSGALRTAGDFYHAAMLFQHAWDSASYHQANDWARHSEALDSTNLEVRWLVAATWDRYQMSQAQPQWYGTQTTRDGGAGPVRLYSMDTTKATDSERLARGVGTLAELRARLDSINHRLGYR